MSRDLALWVSPSPLWGRFAGAGEEPGSASAALADDQKRPAILRFASDDFMEQLLAALERDPARLGEFLARPETWRTAAGQEPDLVEREPLPRIAHLFRRLKAGRQAKGALQAIEAEVTNAKAAQNAPERKLPLKLYQPGHQRYYLVAADLVCATLGFPRRGLATGGREQVGFVMRRVFELRGPDGTTRKVEHAFVKDASGARWCNAEAKGAATALVPGEEMLPLFAMDFRDDSNHPRRLLAGLIPVGRREEYVGSALDTGAPRAEGVAGAGAGARASAEPTTSVSGRKERFKLDVSEPWKNLLRAAFAMRRSIVGHITESMPGPRRVAAAQQFNNQMQMQSWLLLLDLADFLREHVRPVWDAVLAGQAPAGTKQKLLYDFLADAKMPTRLLSAPVTPGAPQVAGSLRAALVAAEAARASLEQTTALYPDSPGTGLFWPNRRFLLAGLDTDYDVAGPYDTLGQGRFPAVPAEEQDPATPGASAELRAIENQAVLLDKLVALVVGAMESEPPKEDAPLPFAAKVQRALMSLPAGDPGWFVIRCVFLRTECGPMRPPLLSPPTQKFQLAGFFDPDAPARPVRIALPLDTTPAGLRKFDKNTALIVSDALCGQMARAKGLGLLDLVLAVLPWPLHKDLDIGGMGPCQKSGGASIGMICSLSIPIVTLCALILLLIIAAILDYIFRWMPYLIMCFPLPGLKAKKGP